MDSSKIFNLDPFNDSVDASNLRLEWEEWHRACELLLELNAIDSQHHKLIFMLARGGRGLQRIYYNLAPVTGEAQPGPVKIPYAPREIPEYDNAIMRLNAFFMGKCNERVELEVFRSLRQSTGESFNRFVLRLRTQAARCDFRDRMEKELLQQITVGANDERVRDKGIENIMNLDEIVNYALNRELLQKQKEKAQTIRLESDVVASVKPNWGRRMESMFSHSKLERHDKHARNECDRCGSWRHNGGSKECTARNATCNKCAGLGHFARKCRAGRNALSQSRRTWNRSYTANTLENGSNQEMNRYVDNKAPSKVA
ncbi:uncharacterized protein LOC131429862 [Malaya genurostris]|uniref:uncharacterized protein LOC131429862 n=1 Tax=Malaya genurostris TaxID=325434 RepID=UPI0026F38E63|nr:uncharacterized protein LOC131429862 [Malaya genurostris]